MGMRLFSRKLRPLELTAAAPRCSSALDADLPAFLQEHVDDVLRLVVAEQLAQLLLVVTHAVLADHGDEAPGV